MFYTHFSHWSQRWKIGSVDPHVVGCHKWCLSRRKFIGNRQSISSLFLQEVLAYPSRPLWGMAQWLHECKCALMIWLWPTRFAMIRVTWWYTWNASFIRVCEMTSPTSMQGQDRSLSIPNIHQGQILLEFVTAQCIFSLSFGHLTSLLLVQKSCTSWYG